MDYDVVIVGGGPAGLSAALALGRACKRVLLCDVEAGRRNAAAEHLHNFVTRDGTPPEEFRAIAHRELAAYPNVTVKGTRLDAASGTKGSFQVALAEGGTALARRLLLAMGMIDEMLPIDGFRELWGRSVFQCPYCHGWEVRGKRWGYLAHGPEAALFPVMLRGWTRDVVVFTGGKPVLPDEANARFEKAGIRIETRAIVRLVSRDGGLTGVEVAGGELVPCDALYAHPPQRQVELVESLRVALDDQGYVRVDPMTRETSVPGVYAGGDLTTRAQGATFAAASGVQAAAMLNHELTAELVVA